jgi:predicted small lipoprotein YifL
MKLALVLLGSLAACGKKAEQPAVAPTTTPDARTLDAATARGSSAAGSSTGPSGSSGSSGSGGSSAAADENPRTSEVCTEVLAKIVECAKDKKFLEALDEGVDAKRKANDKKYLAVIVKLHWDSCSSLPTAIQDEGFLRPDRWPHVVELVTTANALTTCGGLGTALSEGGLFGGDMAN